MSDTRTDLPAVLAALPPSRRRDDLVVAARAGAFHDFKSDSATPKMDLVRELRMLATEPGCRKACVALIRAVLDGAYDEEADAGDVAAMRADLDASAGPGAYDALMGADAIEDAIAVLSKRGGN